MNIIYNDPYPRFVQYSGETHLNGEDDVAQFIESKTHFNKALRTIFSVGAQKDFTFCEIFKECNVHLFEPDKFAWNELVKHKDILDNLITVNKMGIGLEEGNFTYYCDGESILNHRENENTTDSEEDLRDVDVSKRHNKTRSIYLMPLSKYIETMKVRYIDFLKIDVEGLEFDVLKSAGKYLDSIGFIQFEYGGINSKFAPKLNDFYKMFPERYFYHIEKDILRYSEKPLEHGRYSNYLISKIKL